MPCPSCNHTLQGLLTEPGRKIWWCPRCGTLKTQTGPGPFVDVQAPALVARARALVQGVWDEALGAKIASEFPPDGPADVSRIVRHLCDVAESCGGQLPAPGA